MAGGQYPHSWRWDASLAQLGPRLGITAPPPAGPPPVEPGPATARPARSTPRHVWSHGLPETPEDPWPGLLVDWRRGPLGEADQRAGVGGWYGRVVFAVPAAEGVMVVDRWLPADRLTPADHPSSRS